MLFDYVGAGRSDRMTEARTGKDRTTLYGDDGLRTFVTPLAGEPPQAVVQALTGLLEGFGDGLDDDTALLALGVSTSSPTAGPQTGNGSGAG